MEFLLGFIVLYLVYVPVNRLHKKLNEERPLLCVLIFLVMLFISYGLAMELTDSIGITNFDNVCYPDREVVLDC